MQNKTTREPNKRMLAVSRLGEGVTTPARRARRRRLLRRVFRFAFLPLGLQPFTRCSDPRLRRSWQRDRNARARGRVQRVVTEQ